MAKSSFLKHAAVYGLGNLLVYAAGFFLLPLYVRCLSEEEYGVLDVLKRMGEVAILVLLYNGMRQALLAFYNQAKDEQERRAVVGSALFLSAAVLGGGGAIVMLLAGPITAWLDLGSPGVMQIAVLTVVLEALFLMLLALSQAREESTFFVLISVGQFLVQAGLCVLFVPVLGCGVGGILLASAIVAALFGGILFARELTRHGMSIDRRQLRAMFRFAAPFVPGGLGFFLLNSGDRFFLLASVGTAAIGVYALGYKLGLAVKEFSRRPLYQVWNARMYDAARRPDAPVVFGQVFTRVLGAYMLVGLALCLVAGEIVTLIGGDGYRGAAAIIPPVVLAYLFLSAADLMDAAFFIQRKTGRKMAVMLASTVVMLSLYAVFIPAHGIHGAAWATVLGFLFHASLTWTVSQRVFFVQYEWGRLAVLLLSAAGVAYAGSFLPVSWTVVPLKVAVWATWPASLWIAGVISTEEKRVARDMARGAIGWMRTKRPRPAGGSEPGQVAA